MIKKEEYTNEEVTEDILYDPIGELIEHLKFLCAEAVCNEANQNIRGKFLYAVSPETASRIIRLHESVPAAPDPVTVIDEGLMAKSVRDSRYMSALYYALSGEPDEKNAFLWGALKRAEETYNGPGEAYLVDDEGLVIVDREYLFDKCMDEDSGKDYYEDFTEVVLEITDWVENELSDKYLVEVTYNMVLDMSFWIDISVARVALSMVCDDLNNAGGCEAYLTKEGLIVLNTDRFDYMTYEE